MRRAAHIDANQPEIVNAAVTAGATVLSLSALGCGVPDLLVGFQCVNMLWEVKNPERDTPSQRNADKESLKAQADWHAWWRGPRPTVVTSVDQALSILANIVLAEPEA